MHRTIPIFIPMLACPNQCIYCNQHVISGQQQMPSDQEIIQTIQSRLSTIPEGTVTELGFFGGTFTGLPYAEQERLLQLVHPYIEDGSISSIRLSTRPDYITDEGVSLLSRYGVTTVELGVQSLSDEVLQAVNRGYTSADVEKAARIIQSHGIEVGMQMMVGLPNDSAERSLDTARRIIDLGATNTRIYPTLVIPHTQLSAMYHSGQYAPLTLDEAIAWTAPVLKLFEDHHIAVLRVGLHPTEGFINGIDYEAGPFHVAFKQLVQSYIWKSVFIDFFDKDHHFPIRPLTILVSPDMLTAAVGYHALNKKFIRMHTRIHNVKFQPSPLLEGYHFQIQQS